VSLVTLSVYIPVFIISAIAGAYIFDLNANE